MSGELGQNLPPQLEVYWSIDHVKEHGSHEQEEEVLLERQRKKSGDEKDRKEKILLKTINLRSGGHLIYPLPEAGFSSSPSFLACSRK